MMNAAKRAIPFPQVEILPDRAPGRQVLRQCLPLAAGPQHVEDGVEHLADVHGPRSSTALGRADQRLDQRPLHIRQVALVAQSTPIRCPAVLRLPHTAPRSKSGATQRITTASTDSTSFRMGSEIIPVPIEDRCIERHCSNTTGGDKALYISVIGWRH